MMIYKRRVARERRMVQAALLREWRDDLKRERDFEFALMKRQGAVYGNLDDWGRVFSTIHFFSVVDKRATQTSRFARCYQRCYGHSL
jgi:hypothetical protein